MSKIKQLIPLWVKCPAAVLLREFGKLPINLVLCHMYRSFAENGSFSEAFKEKAYKQVHKTTYWYISNRYKDLLLKKAKGFSLGVKTDNPPIWVFWWQGVDAAPDIVKRCIASIQQNANGHPVYIVDQENYDKYVDIPQYIIDKLDQKILSLTHFSDIYRMGLLAKYSGIWIDASIYMQRPFPDTAFETPIYSIRNPGKDISNISNWNWTVGVIGGWKNNFLFQVTYELLLTYWAEHDFLVDYYIFDYMIKLVYENIGQIRECIDAIPNNNSNFYYLQKTSNMPYDETLLSHDIFESTWLFRVSWKGQYFLQTKDGRDTVYANWVQGNGYFQ